MRFAAARLRSPMLDAVAPKGPARLRTVIADSDEASAEMLQIMLSRFDNVELIGAAHSGEHAIRMIRTLEPDLALLSISLANLSGLEVAKSAQKLDAPPAIIMVSASEQFAFDAYEVAATDYLLKPVCADRLSNAIQRVEERRASQNGHGTFLQELWIHRQDSLVCVPISDVWLIEAQGDYVLLHTHDEHYTVHKTIKRLMNQLDPAQFLRVHRSTIVRRRVVKALVHTANGHWLVKLDRGLQRPIGKTYLASVRAHASNA
jgi:DNA-binding LytR/AlgR family response regulator